jgi:hypothetical protein
MSNERIHMIEDDLKDADLFWDVIEGAITLLAMVGIIATLCFMFGYYWYTP